MEPKKDDNGFFYYDQVPENFKVADRDDFFTDDEKLITKKAFLVQGFYDPKIYANRTKPGFDVNKLEPWLNNGRVYVFTNQ